MHKTVKKLIQKSIFMNFGILQLKYKFQKLQFFRFTDISYCIDQFRNGRYFTIIMDNQVLREINHIKYVSKKKTCTIKIFNCLQVNGISSVELH